MPVDKVSTSRTTEKTRDPSRSKSTKLSTSQQQGEDASKVSSSRHSSTKDNDNARRRESSSVRSSRSKVTTEDEKLASRLRSEGEGSRRRESSSVRSRSKVATEGDPMGEKLASRSFVQLEGEGSRRRESSSVRSRSKVATEGDHIGEKLASRSFVQLEGEGSRRRESSSVRSRSKVTTEGDSKGEKLASSSRRRDPSSSRSSKPKVATEERKVKTRMEPEKREGTRTREIGATTTTPMKALRKSVAASGDQVSPSQRKDATPVRKQTVTSEAKDVKTTTTRTHRTSRPDDRSKMADRTTGAQRSEDKSRTKRPDETSRTRISTTTTHLGRPSRSKPSEPQARSKPTARRRGDEAASTTTAAAATAAVEQPKEGRKRTSTRVLSPSEIKMAALAPHVDLAELMGPSTSRMMGAGDTTASVFGDVVSTDDGEEYEDDFEDYESDFEDASSSDADDSAKNDAAAAGGTTTSAGELRAQGDEKKMDSGNYDMADSRRRSQQVRELQVAMERENKDLAERQRIQAYIEKEAPTSLIDEGFEEERTEDWRRPVPKEVKFINFENARKRQKEQKVAERAKRRGEELLSMIRLDVMKYKLFELKPVAYDVYMRSYGRANTAQAHVQTNEDNSCEEVQTDQVYTRDMWTQKPPAFQGGATATLQQDRLGVGGPTCKEDDWSSERVEVDSDKLDVFMSRVGPTMLRLLAEDRMSGKLEPCAAKMRFSRGFVPLGTESVPFLEHRPVTLARFAPGQPFTLLTVHKRADKEDSTQDSRASLSTICVWDLLDPTSPRHILTARHEVTAACFDTARASLVLAGLEDGAICAWDLREKAVTHREVSEHDLWVIRSPTYSTAEVLRRDGHLSRVVALQPLVEKEAVEKNEHSPTQVCSLEAAGQVIIWTVIQSFEHGLTSGAANQDLGLAPWGRVRLVRSAVVSLEDSLPADQMLRENVECLDLQLLCEDPNHLFISTNTGHVLHGIKIGGKPSPRLYSPQSGAATIATCIEVCPFGLPIFLVGCGDGSLRMHRREKERPLSTMEGTGDAPGEGPPIVTLQWSRSRPTVFFVLDATSRIHVWDLSRSDLSPQYTVDLTEKNVTTIQLAPDPRKGNTAAQMVIATTRGSVEVHQLKEEYSHRSRTEETKELQRFKQFTDRL